jgi:aryl-alcohol dehydrogenase-like predicted oxidoreductase
VLHPFLVTPAGAFGIPVCRLGLGFTGYLQSTLTPDDVHHAIDCGVNFLNWSGLSEGPVEGDVLTTTVSALGRARGSVVICAQFGARNAEDAEEELEAALAVLETDYIDVLTLYYVERQEEWDELTAPDGALRFLQAAKQDGRVRRIGVTSHQRKLAARMAESGLLDLLMIRYNAAHRGAEREIFPVTERLGLPCIAYTALRWGALLKPTPDDPPRFTVPRAPDWYRFVLQHPAVSVTLTAPKSRAELDEDLQTLLAAGPFAESEYAAMAAHGDRVKRHAGGFQ